MTCNIGPGWTRLLANNSTNTAALTALSALADVRNPQSSAAAGVQRAGRMLVVGCLYGTASDNGTISLLIHIGHPITEATANENAQINWMPVGQLAATFGNKLGLAGGVVSDTQRYADTLTVTTDYSLPSVGGSSVLRVTPNGGNNGTAFFAFDAYEGDVIRIEGGAATSVTDWNVLLRAVGA